MRISSKSKKHEEKLSLNVDSPIIDLNNAEIKSLIKKGKLSDI